MKKLINRFICLFRGHNWEEIIEGKMVWRGIKYYQDKYYKCQHCGKYSYYKPRRGKIKEEVI